MKYYYNINYYIFILIDLIVCDKVFFFVVIIAHMLLLDYTTTWYIYWSIKILTNQSHKSYNSIFIGLINI